ncbi:MAG: DUF3989 domain-containing protein [Prevotella sp.]|nr:DUF3989 domain-containing protein [Prevotella sp.]
MKQEDSTKPSLLKDVRQRMSGRVRASLDALSPTERLCVVFGMLAIMAVLLLFSIWQTVRDIADRKENATIVIEHIDQPIVITKKDYSLTNENGNGERRKEGVRAGADARRGLGQLIPGGARQ